MGQTRYKILFNGFAISLMLTLCCGFQSSLWFQITDGAPAPQLWLLVFLYLALYRQYFVAMGFIYFLCLIIKSFSAVPLGILWCCFFILVSLTSVIKSRMFFSSTRYFVIAAFAFALVFHIVFFALSHLLEDNPASFSLFTRTIEVLLTTLFAAPMHWLMTRVDRLTLPVVMESQGVRE